MAKLLPCIVIVLMHVACLFSQPLHRYGFENYPDEHEFVHANWTAQGFTVPWTNGFNQSRCFVDDAFSIEGNKSLSVTYPVNTFGPNNNGAQAPIRVANFDELYAGYWVRFSTNFSWGNTNEGGKLPGLAGGGLCSGCATCNGNNGFSARLMWRPNGNGVVYLYHMNKTQACGDNIQLKNPDNTNFRFQKGVWYHIAQRVKINTVGQSNGEVETFVNGHPASLITGLRFVTNTDKVNTFYFSTFHGGGDATWAPTVTCHAWFDDIIISTNRSDVLGPLSLSNFWHKYELQNKRFCFIEDNFLHVDLENVSKLEIANLNGEILMKSNQNYMDITALPLGVYFVFVETIDNRYVQKVILGKN